MAPNACNGGILGTEKDIRFIFRKELVECEGSANVTGRCRDVGPRGTDCGRSPGRTRPNRDGCVPWWTRVERRSEGCNVSRTGAWSRLRPGSRKRCDAYRLKYRRARHAHGRRHCGNRRSCGTPRRYQQTLGAGCRPVHAVHHHCCKSWHRRSSPVWHHVSFFLGRRMDCRLVPGVEAAIPGHPSRPNSGQPVRCCSTAEVFRGMVAPPVAEVACPPVRLAIYASNRPLSGRRPWIRMDMAAASWLLGVHHRRDRGAAQSRSSVEADIPPRCRNRVRCPAREPALARIVVHLDCDRDDHRVRRGASDSHGDQLHCLRRGPDPAGHPVVGLWAGTVLEDRHRSAGCDTRWMRPRIDPRILRVVPALPPGQSGIKRQNFKVF